MSYMFSINSTENPKSHYPAHFTWKGIEVLSRVLPKVNRWKVLEQLDSAGTRTGGPALSLILALSQL